MSFFRMVKPGLCGPERTSFDKAGGHRWELNSYANSNLGGKPGCFSWNSNPGGSPR